MKIKTVYTTFDMNTEDGRRDNWKLTNTKQTRPMHDAVDTVLEVKAFSIFERDNEDGQTPMHVIFVATSTDVYATSSKSFLSAIESYLDAGFSAGSIHRLKVLEVMSKNGRKYLVADFD